MGSVIPLSMLVYYSGRATCHVISCVSRRLMLLLLLFMVLLFWFSHCHGPWYCSRSWPGASVPPQLFFCLTPRLNLRDVFWWANSAGVIPRSGLHLSMHLTGTLNATNSLPHVWTLQIHLFPQYYVVTSMLFLTEPKIVGALILPSPSVKNLSHCSYFSGSSVF